MKKIDLVEIIAVIAIVLSLVAIAYFVLTLFGIGMTFAEAAADVSPAYPNVLKVGESKTINVSRAYRWENIDPSVIRLDVSQGDETAVITGLKPGVTVISVGTKVGQVLTFGYTVVSTDSGGNLDCNCGNRDCICGGLTCSCGNADCTCGADCGIDCSPGCGCGCDGNGSGNGSGGDSALADIPGLTGTTAANTVLEIGGEKWIVIKNMKMEGSGYAMLLKETPLPVKCFNMSGEYYEGSPLQKELTNAYSSAYIPAALLKNAVVPDLGGETTSSVSMPTSKRAGDAFFQKDIIFPLSYKEAADWGDGKTDCARLYLNGLRWWLRTPDGSKWHYVAPSATPDRGNIISTPTIGIDGNLLYIRPAIWVTYKV